jgi:uncharacterized protein YdaU (DUF1376 family)
MYYYQFNIGDYATHTRHLEHMEDLAYRRCLDHCYLHERPLNECPKAVARMIGMKGFEDEVTTVLHEFFTLTDDGWVNERVNMEINNFRAKIEQASRAGKASAQRTFNGRSTDVQPTNNHKPITNNHKPIKHTAAEAASRPKGRSGNVGEEMAILMAHAPAITEQVAIDWLKIRKKAKAPVTVTVMNRITGEAANAGLTCSQAVTIAAGRGWRGFEADWVKTDKKAQSFIEEHFGNRDWADGLFEPATTASNLIEQPQGDDNE